jgi:hypothetical protein
MTTFVLEAALKAAEAVEARSPATKAARARIEIDMIIVITE